MLLSAQHHFRIVDMSVDCLSIHPAVSPVFVLFSEAMKQITTRKSLRQATMKFFKLQFGEDGLQTMLRFSRVRTTHVYLFTLHFVGFIFSVEKKRKEKKKDLQRKMKTILCLPSFAAVTLFITSSITKGELIALTAI